ncbi:hypothetical protein HY212_08005 [Candidatus Pacearchaeota archaeon]|nr:hypothetical protein [Candidatus Pacearchaeota archaeon]
METQTKKLPAFQGKPLIAISEFIPQANFLEGDFGQAALEEYSGRAKSEYVGAGVSSVLKYNHDVVKGSNPFAAVLMNQVLRQEGLRTASPADLERVLKTGTLPLQGQYEDSALVLRDEGDPNSYLASNLMTQVKARNSKQKMPAMIPLYSLDLVKDPDSPHGLAFKLRDDAELIYAPILSEKNNGKLFSKTDEPTGLPKELGEGNRTLYTRNSGLSRVFLDGDLGLDSGYEYLAVSGGGGRVVVVSAEGAADAKLQEYTAKLESLRQQRIAELDERYTRALSIMNDN